MADFIFDLKEPALDVQFVSLMNPQSTFADSGNEEWKAQQLKKLGWSVVDLPETFFASTSSAQMIQRFVRVMQGAIQYAKFREEEAERSVARAESKVKALQEERKQMFEEIVELREAVSLMRLSQHRGSSPRDARSKSKRPQQFVSPLPTKFQCYICGNEYPSANPLQSHLRKRHHVQSDLAQHAAARCSSGVFQEAVLRQPMVELTQSTNAELSAIRTEVDVVKQAINHLVSHENGLQKEVERASQQFSSSLMQVHNWMLEAKQAPTVNPPPVQVIIPPTPAPQPQDQKGPNNSSASENAMAIQMFQTQQKRIESLEAQILEMSRLNTTLTTHDRQRTLSPNLVTPVAMPVSAAPISSQHASKSKHSTTPVLSQPPAFPTSVPLSAATPSAPSVTVPAVETVVSTLPAVTTTTQPLELVLARESPTVKTSLASFDVSGNGDVVKHHRKMHPSAALRYRPPPSAASKIIVDDGDDSDGFPDQPAVSQVSPTGVGLPASGSKVLEVVKVDELSRPLQAPLQPVVTASVEAFLVSPSPANSVEVAPRQAPIPESTVVIATTPTPRVENSDTDSDSDSSSSDDSSRSSSSSAATNPPQAVKVIQVNSTTSQVADAPQEKPKKKSLLSRFIAKMRPS